MGVAATGQVTIDGKVALSLVDHLEVVVLEEGKNIGIMSVGRANHEELADNHIPGDIHIEKLLLLVQGHQPQRLQVVLLDHQDGEKNPGNLTDSFGRRCFMSRPFTTTTRI